MILGPIRWFLRIYRCLRFKIREDWGLKTSYTIAVGVDPPFRTEAVIPPVGWWSTQASFSSPLWKGLPHQIFSRPSLRGVLLPVTGLCGLHMSSSWLLLEMTLKSWSSLWDLLSRLLKSHHSSTSPSSQSRFHFLFSGIILHSSVNLQLSNLYHGVGFQGTWISHYL